MSFRLYDLTQQYQDLMDHIATSEEEGVDYTDTLEALDDALEDKLDNVAKMVKTFEAEAAAYKSEEDRMRQKRQQRENSVKRLKEYAYQALVATNKKDVKGRTFTIARQKNGRSVGILDESLIPKGYFFEQAPQLSKEALLQDLKNGKKVPGVEMKQTESLRIR